MSTLPSTSLNVDPAWIDEYGHMNAAQYVGVFDREGFELLRQVGVGLDYTEATQCGIYTMKLHVDYRRELLANDPLTLRLRLLASDDKRILCLMELWHAHANYLAATLEQLSLHVNLETRRACAFPPELNQSLAHTVATHAEYPLPADHRRVLALR